MEKDSMKKKKKPLLCWLGLHISKDSKPVENEPGIVREYTCKRCSKWWKKDISFW